MEGGRRAPPLLNEVVGLPSFSPSSFQAKTSLRKVEIVGERKGVPKGASRKGEENFLGGC